MFVKFPIRLPCWVVSPSINLRRDNDMRRVTLVLMALALAVLATAPAALAAPPDNAKGAPDFGPHVVVDGEEFGTKAVTALPAPNEHNEQSFDDLYVFTNGAPGQLLVAEYAPGDTEYNGGRWETITVTWNAAGMAAHDPLPVLDSVEDIELHESLGHLDVMHGTFSGGPPPYFECPLLPVLHA